MSAPVYESINEGDQIPSLELPPLTRHTLALYCGGSADHNPLHVDIDFARDKAGLPDVIGHGMLTMAYLGRLLTSWVPQTSLRNFTTRFMLPSQINDQITCTGKVTRKYDEDGERLVDVEIAATRQDGKALAAGTATVALD